MEQRQATRHRTLKGAKIVFNDGRSTISCTVRNLSETGALLRVESVIGIPEAFQLVIAGDESRRGIVVRMTAKELGIRFDQPAKG